MALGVLIGWIAAKPPVVARKLDPQILENVVTIAVIAGVIGARIGYVVLFGRDLSLIQMLSIWEGGLVSHTGYLFGALACVGYLRWKHQTIALWADVLVPAVVLGWSVGRIGDFLSWGEFGIPSSLSWAVSAFGTARHPTQVYESLAYLGLFLISWILSKQKAWRFSPGMVAAFAAFGFGLSRLLIDFLRADPSGYRLVSQGVSVGIMLIAGVWLFKNRKSVLHLV